MTCIRSLFAASAVGALLVGAAACHKASDPAAHTNTNDQQQSPEDYFVQSVYPLIGGSGTCGGCHSGQPNSPCSGAGCVFLGPDGPSSYALVQNDIGLIAAPQNSPLLTYRHTDKSIQLTSDQANVLDIWLGMEAAARNLPGAVAKATSLQDAYKQFGDCMNEEVFVETGMSNLAQAETDFYGPCLGCHEHGEGSLFLSASVDDTFSHFKQFPYIEKLVVGTVDSKGNFKELVPSERIIQKSNEGCPSSDPTACHPQFGLSDEQTNTVRTFVNATLQNLAAGTCQNGIYTTPDAGGATASDAGDGGG